MADEVPNGDRDERGRFRPGWKGGPGNPNVRRLGEYQEVLRTVVSPDRFKVLVGVLLRAGLERDIRAATALVDRILGRPRTEPLPDDLGLSLPRGLRTTKDVSKAANALFKAAASGQISPEDAGQLAGLVEAARRAIETEDLARRIADLESRVAAKEGPR